MKKKQPRTNSDKLNRAIYVRTRYNDLKTAEKLVRSFMRSLRTEPDRQEAKNDAMHGFEQLGLIYFARGRNGRSLYYFNRAIAIAKDLDTSKSFDYERILSVSTRVYVARGQRAQAEEIFAKVIGRLLAKGIFWLAKSILKLFKEFLQAQNRQKEATACQRKIRAVEQKQQKYENDVTY